MKKFSLLPIAAALALAVSCERPMSEADKNAQIEREVQERLAAERQAADQQLLAQQQAELAAREQALADKEAAAASESAVAVATPRATVRPEVQRDEEPVSSSGGRSARSYDTFYRKLEPYGAWRETGDYGYVWQPRQAQQRNWRPYTEGRWAYTDAGWTWVSSEPFGWATYHYGRWTRLRGVGWVWVPGEEWAPAWVSFRTSDQHVGWAPLPPEARFERRTGIKKWADSYYDIEAEEYVFIPNEEIGSENIERAVVPVERNVTIVNETTNVTNITYNNTTIVNEGPDYEALRGRSRRPLERLRLERQYNVEEDQTPQSAVRGDVLAIMTPVFTARAVERPRNVGAPIQQVTVERGSATNANQAEAERARAKMKSEATPPPDAPSKKFDKPAVKEGTPAPVAGPVASPTATPRATPTPAIVATPSPRPSTPGATTTPRPVPPTTPSPIARPSVAPATATPTPKPLTTPAPTATPKPASSPVATPSPRPVTTPAPIATRPASTPAAIATIPASSPALVPTATTAITSPVPAPARKPMPAATIRPLSSPTPGLIGQPDPPEKDSSGNGGPVKGRDLRQPQGTDSAGQPRKREEAINANVGERAGGSAVSPTIAPPASAVPAAPRAVTPRLPVATSPAVPAPGAVKAPQEENSALQGRPALAPAAAAPPRPTAPALITPPPVPPTTALVPAGAKPTPAPPGASPTPTPTPTPAPKKNALKPGRDVDVPDSPKVGPGGTDEP